MVTIDYDTIAQILGQIRDRALRDRVKKQMARIADNPEVGKPMKFGRKGTREVRVGPFRLTYLYENDTIAFADLYHKDEQ